MATSKDIAKRNMEAKIANELAKIKQVSDKEAMSLLYKTTTYKWFADDSYGIAREGTDALLCRVLNELDGNLVY